MSMRVLITGGAGYIGSLLTTRLLEDGNHVTVLDTLYFNQSSLVHCCHYPNFQFIKGDARDASLLKKILPKVDYIIPLACLVGAPLCDQYPEEAGSVNFQAIKLVEQIRSPGQKIIFPTTNSGYGTKSGDFYCDESTPLEPISLYGETKVKAENYLLDRPNVVTLRLATIFGTSFRTRTDLLVNNFVCYAMEHGEISLYEKHFRRNFIHIRDVIDCFLFVMENFDRMQGEAYNLGLNSANISKAELADIIKKQLPEIKIFDCEFGSDPDKRDYIVSNDKLIAAGFEAKRPLDHGIAEMIKAYPLVHASQSSNNT